MIGFLKFSGIPRNYALTVLVVWEVKQLVNKVGKIVIITTHDRKEQKNN